MLSGGRAHYPAQCFGALMINVNRNIDVLYSVFSCTPSSYQYLSNISLVYTLSSAWWRSGKVRKQSENLSIAITILPSPGTRRKLSWSLFVCVCETEDDFRNGRFWMQRDAKWDLDKGVRNNTHSASAHKDNHLISTVVNHVVISPFRPSNIPKSRCAFRRWWWWWWRKRTELSGTLIFA